MRVEALYLMAGNQFKRVRGLQVRPRYPLSLRSPNLKPVATHSLQERPLMARGRYPSVKTWKALEEMPPPPPVELPDQHLVLCEIDNIWPYTPEIAMDDQLRLGLIGDLYQEAHREASSDASKASLGNTLLSMTAITGTIIAALAALLITLVVVQARFGDTTPTEPSAAVQEG